MKALIIGGGIGGPVAAMALQHAGIEAEVCEAWPEPADAAGSFLNTASNGLDVLRTLGVHQKVLEAGFPTPRMLMWNETGRPLGEVANGLPLADGTNSITIRRGRLNQVLREAALARGIRIEFGKKLVDAESTSHGVVARFADGSEASADLLIGADGLHSRTRQLIDPAAPQPRYTGLLSFGGFAHCPALEPTPGAYHMIFGRRAFFGYSIRPGGEVFWFANVSRPHEPSRQELAAISTQTWKQELSELFADDAGPALEMLRRTQEIGAFPVHDLPSVPTWHRGRMVLLGDAVHATSPSSGQGASLAIEDALVLAKCLRDLSQPEQAFRAYERQRRNRVEKVVRYSWRIGQTKSPGAVGRWFRDRLMPFALKHFASPESQAWLYGHRVEWDEKVVA